MNNMFDLYNKTNLSKHEINKKQKINKFYNCKIYYIYLYYITNIL